MPINELRSIAIFVSVAELGSLRKAATAHGQSPQAASHALAQLEKRLDVRLFHRTTRVISLTDEGRRFLHEVQPALSSLQHALGNAQRTKDQLAGPLRIVGPRTSFLPIVWPLIEEFCALHPGVQPDVELEDRIGNWVEGRVDVGFRLGVAPHEGVIARRLFALQLIICATPDYIARFGAPTSPAMLGAHRCTVFRHSGSGKMTPWRLARGGEPPDLSASWFICTNDEELELQAVLSGRCIGQLTAARAAPHLRSGRLLPLMVGHMNDFASYFLYYGSRASQPARVRAFIDLALERLVDTSLHVLGAQELEDGERRALALAQQGQAALASQ